LLETDSIVKQHSWPWRFAGSARSSFRKRRLERV